MERVGKLCKTFEARVKALGTMLVNMSPIPDTHMVNIERSEYNVRGRKTRKPFKCLKKRYGTVSQIMTTWRKDLEDKTEIAIATGSGVKEIKFKGF